MSWGNTNQVSNLKSFEERNWCRYRFCLIEVSVISYHLWSANSILWICVQGCHVSSFKWSGGGEIGRNKLHARAFSLDVLCCLLFNVYQCTRYWSGKSLSVGLIVDEYRNGLYNQFSSVWYQSRKQKHVVKIENLEVVNLFIIIKAF